ncbi:hypothetical protein G6O69_21240 [Pseudenhygromyxa sp. WMMC2535]|uniref:hypothetical protein n=1 Tax=Pseudenhygromyxa sp. WMMC2535 TaxID=2712867 RepID=UPI0015535EC2|nr:hypothetical protein [Pseudenhygromyxa sp. WMMC2535]NVB40378.1 hypothetical protein [Pseudenhygromyxa sp. WMMC2535]
MHASLAGAEENFGMLSTLHEGLVALFLDDPGLAVRLVERCDGQVLTRAPELLEDRHASFAADAEQVLKMRGRSVDALLVARDPDDPKGGLAILIEVQLDDDPKKQERLAAYLGLVVDRHGLPVHLGILCLKDRVARKLASWKVGTALCVHPYVFDHRVVKRVESLEEGLERPVDAILSGVVHGHRGDREAARIALAVARRQPEEKRQRYTATVLAGLPKADREAMIRALPEEDEMQLSQLERECGTFNVGLEEGIEVGRKEGLEVGLDLGREEGLEVGREEGRRGMVRLLRAFLASRGLEPSEEETAVIEAGTMAELQAWAGKMLVARTVAELLTQ